MLYLRTGANGSCKSLFTLKDVRDLQLETSRPVCIIVGDDADPTREYVKIKPEIMKQFGWSTCQFKDWWAQADGTIFFGDECHNYLPKRSSSAAVPQHVSRIAEHRSRGFDFFLTTQHPMNIDEFVRRLIGAPGWHQHLKRVFGGTNVTSVLQWEAVNPQCEKNRSGKGAQVSTRLQPKEVYGWYDSATLHTAKTRIPKQVWYVVAAVIVVPVLAYFALNRVIHPQVEIAGAAAQGSQAGAGGGASGSGSERKPVTAAEYMSAYKPRIAGFMHTAPAYDKLTEPKRVPVPAACVEMKSAGCKCYTQDATPYPVDLQICRQLVAHGAFLAFQPEGERRDLAPAQPVRQGPEAALPGPAAPILMEGGSKSPGASTALVAADAPASAAQARVRPGSPWAFQAGG